MDLATSHSFRGLGLNSKTFVLYVRTLIQKYCCAGSTSPQRNRHIISISYSRDIVPPRAQLFLQR